MKSLKSFETHLSELNEWLKKSKIKVSIKVDKNRLYLLTSIPVKGKLKQKRFYLGLDAKVDNLNEAKKEALKLFGQLGDENFIFKEKEKINLTTTADIIEAFKDKYYSTRTITSRTNSNYYYDYEYCFKNLPLDQPLSVDICIEIIKKTPPNSRKGKNL